MKCIVCGKEAELESMTMISPVCVDCAQKAVGLLKINKSVGELVDEYYVPIAGDITAIRNNKES